MGKWDLFSLGLRFTNKKQYKMGMGLRFEKNSRNGSANNENGNMENFLKIWTEKCDITPFTTVFQQFEARFLEYATILSECFERHFFFYGAYLRCMKSVPNLKLF